MLPLNRYGYLSGLTDAKLMKVCADSLTIKQDIDDHDRLEQLLAEIIEKQEDPKLRKLAIGVNDRLLKNYNDALEFGLWEMKRELQFNKK